MRKIKYSIILFFGISASAFAQLEIENNFGFNLGFVSSFGTHFQQFGVVVQGYGVHNFAQINVAFRLYDNVKNLGPKDEHAEINAAIGLCLGYGKKTKEENLFVNSITNHTGYKNSFSYSYNFWLNKINTSQTTGIISFQFNHFSIIAENDLLSKPALDRFRTGAFLFQYQNKNFQYALNCTMWTGKLGHGVRTDTLFPKAGYLNTEGGVHTNLSHGLLSGQIKYANEYGQYLQLNAGIDDERVRNVVQNKLIHDMPFVPAKYNKGKNHHIPMLDENGNQYLYHPNQKIKNPKLFLNAFTSPNVFY
jgi:hypothetical protein